MALRDGGCTFRLSPTGEMMPIEETTGYMVSLDASVLGLGESKKRLGWGSHVLSERAHYEIGLRSHLIKHHFNLWVGMWVDNGYLHFDISKWVYDKEEAVALGRKYNQKAIYDLANGRDIQVTRSATELLGINEERLSDVLTAALEGYSNYWGLVGREVVDDYITKERPYLANAVVAAIMDGKEVAVYDSEEGDVLGVMCINTFKERLEKMRSDSPSHFADLMAENDDAITSDVLFQYLALGEIVFG